MKQVVAVLAALLLAPLIPATGFGQEPYPNQTIKIVVPYPPGGGVDIIARLLAEPLRESRFAPKIALQGAEPAPDTPEEFRRFLRRESAKFARIIAAAKVTLEQ